MMIETPGTLIENAIFNIYILYYMARHNEKSKFCVSILEALI